MQGPVLSARRPGCSYRPPFPLAAIHPSANVHARQLHTLPPLAARKKATTSNAPTDHSDPGTATALTTLTELPAATPDATVLGDSVNKVLSSSEAAAPSPASQRPSTAPIKRRGRPPKKQIAVPAADALQPADAAQAAAMAATAAGAAQPQAIPAEPVNSSSVSSETSPALAASEQQSINPAAIVADMLVIGAAETALMNAASAPEAVAEVAVITEAIGNAEVAISALVAGAVAAEAVAAMPSGAAAHVDGSTRHKQEQQHATTPNTAASAPAPEKMAQSKSSAGTRPKTAHGKKGHATESDSSVESAPGARDIGSPSATDSIAAPSSEPDPDPGPATELLFKVEKVADKVSPGTGLVVQAVAEQAVAALQTALDPGAEQAVQSTVEQAASAVLKAQRRATSLVQQTVEGVSELLQSGPTPAAEPQPATEADAVPTSSPPAEKETAVQVREQPAADMQVPGASGSKPPSGVSQAGGAAEAQTSSVSADSAEPLEDQSTIGAGRDKMKHHLSPLPAVGSRSDIAARVPEAALVAADQPTPTASLSVQHELVAPPPVEADTTSTATLSSSLIKHHAAAIKKTWHSKPGGSTNDVPLPATLPQSVQDAPPGLLSQESIPLLAADDHAGQQPDAFMPSQASSASYHQLHSPADVSEEIADELAQAGLSPDQADKLLLQLEKATVAQGVDLVPLDEAVNAGFQAPLEAVAAVAAERTKHGANVDEVVSKQGAASAAVSGTAGGANNSGKEARPLSGRRGIKKQAAAESSTAPSTQEHGASIGINGKDKNSKSSSSRSQPPVPPHGLKLSQPLPAAAAAVQEGQSAAGNVTAKAAAQRPPDVAINAARSTTATRISGAAAAAQQQPASASTAVGTRTQTAAAATALTTNERSADVLQKHLLQRTQRLAEAATGPLVLTLRHLATQEINEKSGCFRMQSLVHADDSKGRVSNPLAACKPPLLQLQSAAVALQLCADAQELLDLPAKPPVATQPPVAGLDSLYAEAESVQKLREAAAAVAAHYAALLQPLPKGLYVTDQQPATSAHDGAHPSSRAPALYLPSSCLGRGIHSAIGHSALLLLALAGNLDMQPLLNVSEATHDAVAAAASASQTASTSSAGHSKLNDITGGGRHGAARNSSNSRCSAWDLIRGLAEGLLARQAEGGAFLPFFEPMQPARDVKWGLATQTALVAAALLAASETLAAAATALPGGSAQHVTMPAAGLVQEAGRFRKVAEETAALVSRAAPEAAEMEPEFAPRLLFWHSRTLARLAASAATANARRNMPEDVAWAAEAQQYPHGFWVQNLYAVLCYVATRVDLTTLEFTSATEGGFRVGRITSGLQAGRSIGPKDVRDLEALQARMEMGAMRAGIHDQRIIALAALMAVLLGMAAAFAASAHAGSSAPAARAATGEGIIYSPAEKLQVSMQCATHVQLELLPSLLRHQVTLQREFQAGLSFPPPLHVAGSFGKDLTEGARLFTEDALFAAVALASVARLKMVVVRDGME